MNGNVPFFKSILILPSSISTTVGTVASSASLNSPFAIAISIKAGFKRVELVGKPATSSEESISREVYPSSGVPSGNEHSKDTGKRSASVSSGLNPSLITQVASIVSLDFPFSPMR